MQKKKSKDVKVKNDENSDNDASEQSAVNEDADSSSPENTKEQNNGNDDNCENETENENNANSNNRNTTSYNMSDEETAQIKQLLLYCYNTLMENGKTAENLVNQILSLWPTFKNLGPLLQLTIENKNQQNMYGFITRHPSYNILKKALNHYDGILDEHLTKLSNIQLSFGAEKIRSIVPQILQSIKNVLEDGEFELDTTSLLQPNSNEINNQQSVKSKTFPMASNDKNANSVNKSTKNAQEKKNDDHKEKLKGKGKLQQNIQQDKKVKKTNVDTTDNGADVDELDAQPGLKDVEKQKKKKETSNKQKKNWKKKKSKKEDKAVKEKKEEYYKQ